MALLVSDTPHVMQMDLGANGYYGHEIMDTCRPSPDSEAGDADLSLLFYLDCCEQAFVNYTQRVNQVDYAKTFDYLVFHTPFGGMVKGAHRSMMRKFLRAKPAAIEADFQQRVAPSLDLCQRVGNIMGGTLFMALASILCKGQFSQARRIGLFSYGSGCCSEFYSGVVPINGSSALHSLNIEQRLNERYPLSLSEYDHLLYTNKSIKFGTQNMQVDPDILPQARHG